MENCKRVDLKSFLYKKEFVNMLTKFTVIISQYIHILNQHVVHPETNYVNYFKNDHTDRSFILIKKINMKHFKHIERYK